MATKFFTNQAKNTLYDKLRGIASEMSNFYSFHAVVGFFRSSGYFKLREQLNKVSKIQILVGINIDNIFRKHNKALLMFGDEEEAKQIYSQDFIDDIRSARYSAEVERGILQLCDDLACGKVEMKIHATKNLHAKFYLCLPQNHTPNSDGWVIMGSSNISESGLGITQPPRYELNVAMKDYDDVAFCKAEFDRLWQEAIPITLNDIEKNKRQTHLGAEPTPYELYMKVLIDSFGSQVEDDFSIDIPEGVRDLKYQKDAVIQGYQMLRDHNGFFLADVVGLGKTIVATMIAKRFVEANGRNTNILVVYPPAVEQNWKETFKLFDIYKKTQFVSNGSLSKILEGKDNYKDKEDFDLVIVDEAHGFRSDNTNRYDELQCICKASRGNVGLVQGTSKKIMLLSATPLNNRPTDLLNLILLFQNSAQCTIEGISNLKDFFAPKIEEYNKAMNERGKICNTNQIDKIYEDIRNKVLDKITVRRTRHNITNDEYYRKDLEERDIHFPEILPPIDLNYEMDNELEELFYSTLELLTDMPTQSNPDGKGLYYARYRAVENFTEEKAAKYKNVVRLGENLAGIYRVHMVKRLESSFYAFRRSLNTLLRITKDMINMFDEGKIIVAPELKVKDLQAKGFELDKIIEYAINKGYEKAKILYTPKDFDESFLSLLESDRDKLLTLKTKWDEVKETDPKLDLFVEKLNGELFDHEKNPTGKLVVFSESVDTVNYLTEKLTERLRRNDILKVSSGNRTAQFETIRQCFDANYDKKSDEYNILITSDVLAEGVNLHLANVIVNYDTPWNATRLMQRIGRVNRIGSVAGKIYNYMFYPSKQGDAKIKLYENALIKLQGFHSALGEDAQIFSREEIVKEFQMFNPNLKDKVDKQLELLREVRELYNTDRALYKKIKALPLKSRAVRTANNNMATKTSIVFISSSVKTEYYKVSEQNITPIDFLDAAAILKAPKNEKVAPFANVADTHFEQVNRAMNRFENDTQKQLDDNSLTQQLKTNDKNSAMALKFIRLFKEISDDGEIKTQCATLLSYIQVGVYSQLTIAVRKLAQKYNNDRYEMKENEKSIERNITDLYNHYYSANGNVSDKDKAETTIVISETFI